MRRLLKRRKTDDRNERRIMSVMIKLRQVLLKRTNELSVSIKFPISDSSNVVECHQSRRLSIFVIASHSWQLFG
jgi:hypothetical protein